MYKYYKSSFIHFDSSPLRVNLNHWDDWNRPLSATSIISTTSNDAEKSTLAPIGSPRVSSDPVLGTILNSPSVKLDGMIGSAGVAGIIHVDATRVGLNALSVDVGRHGSTSIDLSHDVLIALNASVLRKSDGRILGNGVASHGFIVITVHAIVDIRAFHVLGLVLLASDIRNTILVDVSVGSTRVTSVAATSMTTVNHSLDGWDHISFLSTGGDLDSISD